MHNSPRQRPRGGILNLLLLALAITAACAIVAQAQGLSSGAIPSPSYHGAIELLYRGEFNRAQRSFTSEVNGAIKTVQARWIDSICYHAMLGEVYYQLGRNREALAEFDQAIEFYLAYPDWLLRVKFQQAPRPDTNRARFIAPWGQSDRQITYGYFSDTMLVAMGRIDNSQQVRQGGVVQQAQFWKLNVFELVRTTSLAIRRRNEILGPLTKHDRLSRDLVNTLAKGGIAPANHWSGSLVELQLGLAQAGMDNPQEALTHLGRAVLIDGRYDHPLTGAALLAQGLLAKEAGNLEIALSLFNEASLAAYAYEDWDVVGEALWQGHQVHVASGGQGPYAPLEAAATWANRSGMDLLTLSFRVALAEGLLLKGDIGNANSIAQVAPRRRELQLGIVGIRQAHLQSLLAFIAGQDEIGQNTLAQALARQMDASIRNFQIFRTIELVDAGTYTSRIAVGVFAALLHDPTPGDWTFRPLEMIAVLGTDHQGAFDRWFLASLDRKEIDRAVEISDLAKRRRFFANQPLGGRLVALRHVLESPESVLSREAILQRKGLLQRFPEYAQLATDARAMRRDLDAAPQFDATGTLDVQVAKRVADWSANALRREALLKQMALRREVVEMAFPPARTTADVQKLLKPGQALLVFHQPGDTMFAFLVTSGGTNAWQLPKSGPLKTRIGKLHREIANFNNQRTLSSPELTGDEWRAQAAELSEVLFAMSKLDLTATTELAIVPDGPLWFVPFEALPMASSSGETLLVDAAPVRYAPTAGLAVGDATPLRPVRATGIALPAATASSPGIDEMWQRLAAAVEHPVRISGPLTVDSPLVGKLFDQLLVLVDSDLSDDAGTWSPLPLDRGGNAGALARWIGLPYEAPERMLLTGVRMTLDLGQRSRRRSSATRAPTARDGEELFQAACGLFSTGARTLLLTRWQTGGAVQEALTREFASEMSRVPAGEAWQRSVRLARAMPLDPAQEPRFRITEEAGDMPTADHPFFWSGFVLFDTGRDPREIDAEPMEEERVVEASKPAIEPAPMPPSQVPSQPDGAPPADAPPLPAVPPLPELDDEVEPLPPN
ncbi:MAG: hypothetical protein WD851_04655 [Pirellulales bacterium]